ncbi:tetratricopeptide repeat protein [Ramlibacter sp.]|uniref:tetratricopeptide repeat protein n=1 Tax=Ramlibacter sp. TaxID=1917967 RepID=UPI003D0CD2F9
MTDNATPTPDPDRSRDHFREGVRLSGEGDFAAAEKRFEQALALDPARLSPAVYLASCRMRLGRPGDALVLLHGVLDRDPEHIDALGLRGAALAMIGQYDAALDTFERALRLRPDHKQARAMRRNVLHELGRLDEAKDDEEAAREVRDPEVEGYNRAAASNGPTPPSPPRAYVRNLFDHYAANYDQDLLDTLHYRVPAVLTKGVADIGRRFENALDLGCGTGLCGPLLKPLVDRLEGVDLSPEMIERARPRGVYDALHVADIAEFLADTRERYDLVVAGDVFIYVGALDTVFERVAQHMHPGGIFCFTVEAHPGPEPLVLRRSRRYAHAEAPLRELAAKNGFEVLRLEHSPLRDQGWEPLAGFYVWLAKRSADPREDG